jgi:glycosyltransferase involved in cell wall biosynthesis
MTVIRKTPTVSVILPTYNRAELIGRAIKSILSQTYQDFEIIVVDDGSTDNTEEVVKSFDDKRIKYIVYKRNKGAAIARNVGIKAAMGEYIAFQDSDDEWLPLKLEKQLKVFDVSPAEVGVVYTGFWRIKDKKKIYLPFEWVKQKDGNIHKELIKGNFVSTQTILVKKECFKKSGLFDENLRGLLDWELFIRISNYYNFKYIEEPLLIAYHTLDSITADSNAITEALEIIIKKHFEYFAEDRKSLVNHYFVIGKSFYSNGETKKGRYYMISSFKLNPLNIKLLVAILLFILNQNLFNEIVNIYKRIKYMER